MKSDGVKPDLTEFIYSLKFARIMTRMTKGNIVASEELFVLYLLICHKLSLKVKVLSESFSFGKYSTNFEFGKKRLPSNKNSYPTLIYWLDILHWSTDWISMLGTYLIIYFSFFKLTTLKNIFFEISIFIKKNSFVFRKKRDLHKCYIYLQHSLKINFFISIIFETML